MSYRSIKRVLGENSLERKCLFLFAVCLLALIAGSFWLYGKVTDELVNKQNPITGRLLVDTIMTRHHAGKFEQNPEFRDAVSGASFSTINLSYRKGFIRPYPTSDGRDQPIGSFEHRVLQRFLNEEPFEIQRERAKQAAGQAAIHAEETPSAEEMLPVEFDQYEARYSADRTEYVYYQPIYATKTDCVICHNGFPSAQGHAVNYSAAVPPTSPKLALNDLMAVVRVHIPMGPTIRDLNTNRGILWATAIITVFLSMLASYMIVRYVIVKPLKHLREVSDAVSRGQVDMRAEIHTGDEFEALGVAFNRMLRHLIEAQQELRHLNADLDSKVDQLAQMNMRLYEMNRLKGDFLATMSHELRTPLNSIIGFSDVLSSISSLDEKQKRYVQNIQKSGKMLLDMINDILDLAKIESGKMELRPTHFRIAQVIGALCDMCRPLSEKRNIDLETNIQPNLPELQQDQGKVQQILNNLLSNAIKFTPEGGRIDVSARRDSNGDLVLVVADTGVGIAEEDQTKVFEKFRQGNVVLPSGDAMTREYSGTGLGLSIVKELCKLLGGEIALKSELGKGSEFTVRLPWVLPGRPDLVVPLVESVEELIKPRRNEFAKPLAATSVQS